MPKVGSIINDSSQPSRLPEEKFSRNGFAGALHRATHGTDEVEIGNGEVEKTTEVEGSTMEDAAKLIVGVRYLLKGWIPYGMLTGLIAEPGRAKSAFALWLARTIVTGGPWFNGMKSFRSPRSVLWCSTEHDMAITIDRMCKWKIPKGRIILPFADPLQSIQLTNEEHLQHVEALVHKHKTPAVIIDSLRAGHDRDENESAVGKVLQNLAVIAQRTNAAVIVVHHTKKLSVGEEVISNSSRGSNAIIANFRAMIAFDKPDLDLKNKWVRVRQLDKNLCVDYTPVGLLVTNDGLKFGPAPEKPKKESAEDIAVKFLDARIKPGQSCESKPLIDEAEQQEGIATATLARARESLGIVSDKSDKSWVWKRPSP
ncbi:MAG: AAA family ATPase [Gemmataceae bacterium]|nr:AAA family ATPase [Gemmataceae bacterium]MCI0741122.1 AAA family ATPase [Gemmataceae bacterium]